MESCPREGPTVLCSMILTGAGKAPALRTMARSLASSMSKRPVIWALPSGNPLLDDGGRVNIVVQDDGQSLLHIGAGDLLEKPGADVIKLHGHIGLMELGIEGHPRILDHITRHQGLLFQQVRDPSRRPCLGVHGSLIEKDVPSREFPFNASSTFPSSSNDLKLQQGRLSNEIDCPFRVPDPRELNQYLILPWRVISGSETPN